MARVEIARRTLQCNTASVVNLFPSRLDDVNALRDNAEVWTLGRTQIERELHRTDSSDVLLGYGVGEPVGEARQSFRSQLDWLARALHTSPARVWAYGGRPTHPSRWHRVAHRHAPGIGVEALASLLLVECSFADVRD
jgi:hypothetical protein